MKGMQHISVAIALSAACVLAAGAYAFAQPIFTTAPVHLQGIDPIASRAPAARQKSAEGPAAAANPPAPLPPRRVYPEQPPMPPARPATQPRMLPIPGFPSNPAAIPSPARPATPADRAPIQPPVWRPAETPNAAIAQQPPAPRQNTPVQTAPVQTGPRQTAPVQPPAPVLARPAPVAPASTPLLGQPPAAPVTLPVVAGNAPGAKADTSIIRHLTNTIQGFRLSGEIASSEWPVYFTQAQTQHKLQFQLGYLSAVSVMPEASFIKLTINDTLVGRANIQPTQGVRTIVFDIPPGLVQPGFNSIRLSADQHHRVDCSIAATYELWTQVDPGKTGFVLPPGDGGATGFSDLAALPPDEQGSLPVRVVLPGKTSPQHIERIMRAVQIISLVGRFEQPVVDVGALASGQYGINLVIGAAQDIQDVLLQARTGPINEPRAIIVPATSTRRTTVILTGRSDAEVDLAFRQMNLATQIRGTPAGLRAARAFPGYRVDGGQRVKLREFGIPSQEFSGRLFRAAFNLIMPPDFYPADYGKATLDLAGGYAAGLDNSAQIVVSVNGRNAVSQKLPKTSGDVFKQNPIPLQLGHLRPGLNRIEIEAQVPVAEDKACDPLAAINGRKRFLLLDTTEIELPKIARIARVPDLAITATGGFPYAGSSQRPNLYVPLPDRHAVGAAATLAAHLAISAGQPIDFRFAVTRPQTGSGPTLVLAPLLSLDADAMSSVGLKRDEVHAQWQERLYEAPKSAGNDGLSEWEQVARNRLVLQRNFPAACHLPKPPGGFRTAFLFDRMPVGSVPNGEEPERDLFGEWDTRIRNQSRIMGYVSGFIRDISDWARGKYSGARVWIDEKLELNGNRSPISNQASLIMAQNILGDTTNDVWTIVTAPNTGWLAQSVACLVDPRVWRQVAGRIAVLNAGDGAIVDVPATDSRLIPTQPLSIQNVRLIIAGWFSLNGKIYVFSAMMIALLLALSTHWFLRNVGRRVE